MDFQSPKKTGVKSSLSFERSQLSPGAKLKKSEAAFVDLPFFFHSAKTVYVNRNSLKWLTSTKRGAFFRHFAFPR